VLPRDLRDDDVQALPARERGVDERGGEVEAPPRGHEHALDEVTHLGGVQENGGQLGAAVPSGKHLSGEEVPLEVRQFFHSRRAFLLVASP
jgi:hypothetical protein